METVADLEHRRLKKTIAEYGDRKLVMAMLTMLSEYEDTSRAYNLAGQSENSAFYTRCVFTEIVERWVPADVMVSAMDDLYDLIGWKDDEDDA